MTEKSRKSWATVQHCAFPVVPLKSELSEYSPSSQDTGEGTSGFESETHIDNSSDTEELSESNPVEKEELLVDFPSSEKIGEEILRVETDNFTLTIECPEIPQENQHQPPAVPLLETTKERFIRIVVKGDTLWDIADHHLGNPFRYPELAQLSHIRDPHWIYPGDIITIVRKKLPAKLIELNPNCDNRSIRRCLLFGKSRLS